MKCSIKFNVSCHNNCLVICIQENNNMDKNIIQGCFVKSIILFDINLMQRDYSL